MSLQRKMQKGKYRRALRVRSRIKDGQLRVSVFRSLKYIYAQIIDDSKHCTLASYSSREIQAAHGSDKKAAAFEVGKKLAEKARAQGIDTVVFDRGPHLYHGRVKSVADGLREGGLKV